MSYPSRANRVQVQGRAEIIVNGWRIPGRARNLSLTGMALHCSTSAKPGDPVWVGFNVPEPQGRLSLHGIVVRVQSSRGSFVWGVQFKGLDAALIACIQRYMEDQQSIFRQPPPLSFTN